MPPEPRPPIAGVFFDLYGTLLLYGDMDRAWVDWLAALRDAFGVAGLTLDPADLGRACEGLFTRPEPPDDGVHTLYERRLLGLASRLGVDLEGDALALAVTGTVSAWQLEITLDPQARRLLDQLAPTHRRGLVTNFDHPPHVRGLLAELDLERCFDVVVISGDVGVTKPNPRIFDSALEATGLEAREVAYVGDAPEDIEAASAAGMLPIAIRRDGAVEAAAVNDYGDVKGPGRDWTSQYEGVVVIRDLQEVDAAIVRAVD